MIQVFGLIGWFVVSYAAAAIGFVASLKAKQFYGQLDQPSWAPPAFVFGPVWTVLYALMAIAAWLVWRSSGFDAGAVALSLFLAQLALNALWSWLFFAWHRGSWAFAEILVLWVLIVATTIAFFYHSLVAGILLIPYLVWVSFAAILNGSVWRRNPEKLA